MSTATQTQAQEYLRGTSVSLAPEQALSIINTAMQVGMYPAGQIPESDSDKVSEAQQLLELSLQAKMVADQIGFTNIPKWAAVKQILVDAGIFTEAPGPFSTPDSPPTLAGSPTGYADPPAVAQAPPVVQPQQVAAPSPPTPEPPVAPVAAAVPQPAPTAPSAPQLPVAASQEARERWVDNHGTQWDVVGYGSAPELKAYSVPTGELTVLPASFLSHRYIEPPAEAQAQVVPPDPQPAPVQQEPAPSLPPSPSPAPVLPPSSSPSPSPLPVMEEPTPVALSNVPSGVESSAASLPFSPPSSFSTPPSPTPEPQVLVTGGPVLTRETLRQHDPTESMVPVYDSEGDVEYKKVLDQVAEDYSPEGMPAPMDLDRQPWLMPDDLTLVDDVTARALHSQRNALASRARYLYGIEKANARGCARVKDKYLKPAMREARAQLGKDASVTEVTQLAEDNEEVAKWILRIDRHDDIAEALQTHLKFYTEDVSVLSRDWAMRAREEAGS